MLKLGGYLPVIHRAGHTSPYLATVTRDTDLLQSAKGEMALLAPAEKVVPGYKAVILDAGGLDGEVRTDVFALTDGFDHLSEGDIVRLNSKTGAIRVLFRRNASSNTILLTERCDHYCLMCSQPPKARDDSWLFTEAFELITRIPTDAQELIFSGGEPTLYGRQLVELIEHSKKFLPKTAIHVLSNGRAFKNADFARSYVAVEHPDLMTGIPLYSDDPVRHDYVVQSRGAFNETIQGIVNLKKVGGRVEVRIVLHKQTLDRLVSTCEFIARNLIFVDHVALMGLEPTGFARLNIENLWVDPYEYKDILSEATNILNSYRIPTSIYNHQLCTVNADVIPNCRKSISDWKREYLPECTACARLNECGGLFHSAQLYRYSRHIRPMATA